MNVQLQQETQAGIEIARLVEHAHALGEIDPYRGKRAWPRFTAALQLEATRDPQDPSSCWTVSMHNVSTGGFAAWSQAELERHDTLYVREFASEGERPWLKAVVRHCTRGIRGYLIGAEFMEKVMPAEQDNSPPQQDVGDTDPRNKKIAHLMASVRRYRGHGFQQG